MADGSIAGQIVVARPSDHCPACGAPMSRGLARVISVLSRRQMQLFLLLRLSNAPMTVGDLAAHLFSAEEQGGPEWADGVVTTAIARLRKKVRQHDLPFRIWNAPEGGYRLEWLPEVRHG